MQTPMNFKWEHSSRAFPFKGSISLHGGNNHAWQMSPMAFLCLSHRASQTHWQLTAQVHTSVTAAALTGTEQFLNAGL